MSDEAIRAHYNLPVSAIATVTHNASGNELNHLMQVRLLDGREGKFCFVQDVKSLIRREDIHLANRERGRWALSVTG